LERTLARERDARAARQAEVDGTVGE
jgi:hypothetical protein